MKKIIEKILVSLIGFWVTLPVFAGGIPGAPTITGANNNQDYVQTGKAIFYEAGGFAITAMYVISVIVYCGGLLFVFVQAKKTKEWGNFFSVTVGGLVILVIILILLNLAQTAITG